ncbi:RagB/SusD family nutrient uptake outer membrane protein [Chryseobacterium indologenes]|uniref:RagB/SusD family nutrient uptake outer membrane protein n=1 Tax=Chryseobacterium indologenes TaxID=253 RepID=UPI000B514F75|nr:RagB/SusD family nutrient uptake outer membrane protein [Chryseobacterium indologenes]ASE62017.1 RagB/SusD family nutrient uptake outer membrane protein [Chryseobacterium indologenes]
MKTLFSILFMTLSLVSCKKQDDWLDKKSSKSDVIPTSLDDFQAILDNDEIMNLYYPSLGIIGSDNYLISDASFNSISDPVVKTLYTWAPDIYEGRITGSIREWSTPYQLIEYANIALEGIEKIAINSSNNSKWNNVKGSALFYRSLAFYNLAQLFCKPFDPQNASSDLGIPLRLNSDVNIVSKRATVKQTYDQIISDLLLAESLLPEIALYKTQPSKAAVNALLAKTYLLMGDYQNALKFAESALKINSSLIDFNSLSSSTTYSFPNFQIGNPEIIFFARALSYGVVMTASTQIVSPDLYNSYGAGDLRKKIFYRGNEPKISFTGKYTGGSTTFSGLATNELYLIKSECLFRLGNFDNGISTLNLLLKKRWDKNSSYESPVINKEEDALRLVLNERRKELPFTSNTRWEDLRRFNKDNRFAISLTRIVNGKEYTLPANDPRYVYPIPPLEILKSNLEQNIR